MAEASLRSCRVLVVEDEYLLAEELRVELEGAEAIIIGPVGQLDAVIEIIKSGIEIDGAILDVNLGGENIFPAADLLANRGVPMVFTTGYDAASIPARYANIVRCEKPVTLSKVVEAIGRGKP